VQARSSYSLEARDRVGVFLGMSSSEVALIGGAFVVALLARAVGFPVPVCAAPLVTGAALAKITVGGRPLWEWIPLLSGWLAARRNGRRRWTRALPLLPGKPAADWPPMLRGVEVREVTSGGRTLAAVCDPRGARVTVVCVVRGAQFACRDADVQDALLASWSDVLSGASTPGNAVVQIGWSDAAWVAGLGPHRDWVEEQLTAARAGADLDGPVGDPAAYEELLAELHGFATVHETVVWLTVDGSRVRETKGKVLDRALAQLPAAVDNLLAALRSADLDTDGPLPASGLWRLLRSRIDPTDELTRPEPRGLSLAERLGLVGAHNAGPVAVAAAWSHLRLDGSYHRTFWVDTWPRRPVPGDWLQGFLAAGETRTMTVIHRPLDPERSRRRIESQMVKLSANRARKIEKDRRVSESDLRTEQAVHELESDIASGHAEVLYLGLVTVSAPTLEDLDAAARRIMQTARARGLGLRVLHGRQDVGWGATLPFGLAEPRMLDVIGI
jgi:hypothetical protein